MDLEELEDAFDEDNVEKLKELIKAIPDNQIDWSLCRYDDDRSILHRVVEYGNAELVRLVLSRGANVNKQVYTEYGYEDTPLHMAETVEIAEILINAGANVNSRNYRNGCNVLDNVVMSRNTALVQLLISHGVEHDPRVSLHSVEQNDLATLTVFIENGYDIGVYSNALLKTACSKGFVEITQYLLSKGADPDIFDDIMTRIRCQMIQKSYDTGLKCKTVPDDVAECLGLVIIAYETAFNKQLTLEQRCYLECTRSQTPLENVPKFIREPNETWRQTTANEILNKIKRFRST